LVEAQLRKLDYHIAQAEIMPGARVLDIGCGWGSLMLRVMEQVPDALCVGLTLSKDQKAFVDDKRIQGIDVRLASWAELQDTAAFDAVISIGAMEHFAQPGLTSDEKTAIYRGFFKKVRQALKPGGWLSLQTITFDRLQEAEFRSFITERIFPGSMLPRPAEVISAADRVLSLVNCRNDARDYARTCRVWAGRLERSRDGAIAVVGEEKVSDYIQYLRMSAAAFERSGFSLYRLKFRSYPEN
jgi:cyclopropane-fatty-acyl-phospholipid synthase